MAYIFQTIFQMHFCEWKVSYFFLIKISPKFVPKGIIDNNLALA